MLWEGKENFRKSLATFIITKKYSENVRMSSGTMEKLLEVFGKSLNDFYKSS